MNGINDTKTLNQANKLLVWQSDENIRKLYNDLKSNPKIKWKESIKKIVNIEVSTIKGLDR